MNDILCARAEPVSAMVAFRQPGCVVGRHLGARQTRATQTRVRALAPVEEVKAFLWKVLTRHFPCYRCFSFWITSVIMPLLFVGGYPSVIVKRPSVRMRRHMCVYCQGNWAVAVTAVLARMASRPRSG